MIANSFPYKCGFMKILKKLEHSSKLNNFNMGDLYDPQKIILNNIKRDKLFKEFSASKFFILEDSFTNFRVQK